MAATVRNMARGLVLALLGLAVPLGSPPFALAQGARDGIDLNGIWKMDGAYVSIEHSGTSVKTATIYTGGKCHGTDRSYIIEGELSVTTTPAGIESTLSGRLRVCSGSPDLVQRCGSGLSSYDAAFSNATVENNRISGERRVQYVEGCRPTGYPDTRHFELTRDACTAFEGLVADTEESLGELQREAIANLDVFSAAHSAAQARYGDTFDFWGTRAGETAGVLSGRTNILLIPYTILTGNYSVSEASGNLAAPEAFYERLRQVVSGESTDANGAAGAFDVARTMTRDGLVQAAAMVREHSRLEQISRRFKTDLDALHGFRTALDLCRQTNPGGQ